MTRQYQSGWHFYTVWETETAHPALLRDAPLSFPAFLFFFLCLYAVLSVFLSPYPFFLFLSGLSRRETVMVEPGERANFASSALFLCISVVLYVVLSTLQDRKNRHTHTRTQFCKMFLSVLATNSVSFKAAARLLFRKWRMYRTSSVFILGSSSTRTKYGPFVPTKQLEFHKVRDVSIRSLFL